jgi:hypothetical protein
VYRLRYPSSLQTALFHFIIGPDVQGSNRTFQNLTLPAGNRARVKLFVVSPSLLYPCCGYKKVFLAFCIHVVDTKKFSYPFVSMLWIQRSSPSLLYSCCGWKEVFLAFCIHVVDTKKFSYPFVSLLWIQRSFPSLLYPCCGYKEVFLAFCIHVVDTKKFS